ncbi:hypothetical protein HNQ77_002391 [Silvibacterium bohemicum]|uniref:Uncharacterized protein n=1 Tax=Silvibacterium bohemicum TaxID=1577686 RepID=A0A841JXH2_9BACT|nr:hypothetical protein [Silvibacterium bohemicum]
MADLSISVAVSCNVIAHVSSPLLVERLILEERVASGCNSGTQK